MGPTLTFDRAFNWPVLQPLLDGKERFPDDLLDRVEQEDMIWTTITSKKNSLWMLAYICKSISNDD